MAVHTSCVCRSRQRARVALQASPTGIRLWHVADPCACHAQLLTVRLYIVSAGQSDLIRSVSRRQLYNAVTPRPTAASETAHGTIVIAHERRSPCPPWCRAPSRPAAARAQQRSGPPPDFVVVSAPPAGAAAGRVPRHRELQPGWDEARALPTRCCPLCRSAGAHTLS